MINIKKELFNSYIIMLTPVIIAVIIIYLSKLFVESIDETTIADRSITIVLFVLSAAFSVAFPIFYRTLFVNKNKTQKEIDINDFINFEKKLLLIAMIAPYFIPVALIFNLASFYVTGIILFGFYSMYYYYPSEKRINFEKKLFRIK